MKTKSLLDFIKEEGATQAAPAVATARQEEARRQKAVDPVELAERLHEELCRRNKMKKGELMELAKQGGASVRDVLMAVEMLVLEGRLRKRLDDGGELVYAAERC